VNINENMSGLPYFQLLDCTLRDGGYVNDWKFEDAHSKSIIEALHTANVELIECGYLSDKVKRTPNLTIFNTVDEFNALINETGVPTSGKPYQLLLMIDYGTYDVDKLPPRDTQGNHLDGIRLVFHTKEYIAAMPVAEKLIAKGYKTFIQPMVTSFYTDAALLDLIERSNALDPYAFYIVDSFGFLDRPELRRMFYLINRNLKPTINLGLHLHNNMQLAFSNAMDFLDIAAHRRIILDSSVFGMGRGAGNLNTELFADYLNKQYGRNYQIVPILQIIDNFLESIYREQYWGYSVAHFLSAAHRSHPNNASYLVNKKTLSVADIAQIIGRMEPAMQAKHDKKYLDQLYFQYRSEKGGPSTFDGAAFRDRDIVILASGKSILRHEDRIVRHVQQNNSLVVAVNHVPVSLTPDLIFFTNQRRYDEFENRLPDPARVVVSSNISVAHNLEASIRTVDYTTLLNPNHPQVDNVTIHLLNLFIQHGVQKVSIAGLDGFAEVPGLSSYAYNEYTRVLDNKEQQAQNELLAQAIAVLATRIRIHFLTPSVFAGHVPLRVVGIIPARYKSSRFEGKPLVEIAGIPMLERTYRQAVQAKRLDQVIVATDDDRIRTFCEQKNIPVVMTSDQHPTGTDRLAEVARQLDYDLYINIQGDEPVISPETIDQIIDAYQANPSGYMVYNLYKKIEDPAELTSPTIIKTIVSETGELVYMSRSAVPFNKSEGTPVYYKQVCVYGFTREALELFAASTNKSKNEQFEDIEILRFIDRGYRVRMIETTYDSIAVDIPEDVAKVEKFLAAAV
jgi:3-deoxy-D-manno-octulosonate cytidylyltransferase